MKDHVLGSLTRISNLDSVDYDCEPLDRAHWAAADYVVGEVVGAESELYRIELADGRTMRLLAGNRIVGAFGDREATLEGVGSWRAIRNGDMHSLTGAGLIGRFTSKSVTMAPPLCLKYKGHVLRQDRKVTMGEFAMGKRSGTGTDFRTPTILIVGTSMSAGKTTTGRLIVHLLASAGFSVIGAKLTGAGRYRDIVSFADAGASAIYDFVDAGLPSTVIPDDVFREAIRPVLQEIDRHEADFLVAEAGASPLEPYNGRAAIEELNDTVCCRVLCASDPYAVVGVQQAFGLKPDLVCGPAASTSAAIRLVTKLSGLPSINVMQDDAAPRMRAELERILRIPVAVQRS